LVLRNGLVNETFSQSREKSVGDGEFGLDDGRMQVRWGGGLPIAWSVALVTPTTRMSAMR
jgi:hypothetical protein